MAGTTETIAALVSELDSVVASNQGPGAITASRVRALLEDLVASIAPSEVALTFGATMTWNLATNPIAQVTLTGNVTLTVSGGEAGATYRLALIQDGTGSRAVTLSGVTMLGTAAWATAAAGVNILTVDDINGTLYAVVT